MPTGFQRRKDSANIAELGNNSIRWASRRSLSENTPLYIQEDNNEKQKVNDKKLNLKFPWTRTVTERLYYLAPRQTSLLSANSTG